MSGDREQKGKPGWVFTMATLFGAVIGAALGAALRNLAVGLSIGVALGVALGIVMAGKIDSGNEEE